MSHDAPAPDFVGPPMAGIGPWIQSSCGVQVTPLELEPEQVTICDVTHALSMAPRFAGHTCRPYSVGEHSIYVAEAVALDLYILACPGAVAHLDHIVGRVGDLAARLRVEHAARTRGILSAELGRLAVAVVWLTATRFNQAAGRRAAWRILRALVHDASEAYLADVPTPVKVRLPGYKAIERIAQAACVTSLVPLEPCPDPAGPVDTAGKVKCADHAILLVEKARLLTVDLPDWSPGIPRNRYWACLAHAAVSHMPGSLSDWERRAYLERVNGQDTPPDPHSPLAVESAFYYLYTYLMAVVRGEDAHQSLRLASEVRL